MKLYTNQDQTAKLIELGFEKPKTVVERKDYGVFFPIEEVRHYSIGELVEMLMKVIGVRISFDSMYGGRHHLIVKRLVGDKWDILYGKVGKELSDLLLDAIVKLKEKGVI